MATPTRDPHTTPSAPLGPANGGGTRRVGPSGVGIGRLLLLCGLMALLGAGALAGVLFGTGAIDTGDRATTVTVAGPAQTSGARASALDARAVYAAAAPGVVDITAKVVTSTSAQVPDAFAPPESQEATQTGTGSTLDTDGHILTAEHVVSGARSISVRFQDGTTRAAKLAGHDSAADVAVLKVDPQHLTLHPLVLGTSKSLRVGDPIALIGDPFGYPRSLSTGLVSGLDRTIQAPNGFTVPHAIQTDAALNPGNSGGPLLDARARLIGIADQIATGGSDIDSYTGVGFAVPIDIVTATLPDLERGVTPKHAYLGVSAADATTSGGESGALVHAVSPGSPAADAGVQSGDLIVRVDGAKVSGASDLVAAIAAGRPGDHLKLGVQRGSQRLSVDATLATQPGQAAGG